MAGMAMGGDSEPSETRTIKTMWVERPIGHFIKENDHLKGKCFTLRCQAVVRRSRGQHLSAPVSAVLNAAVCTFHWKKTNMRSHSYATKI